MLLAENSCLLALKMLSAQKMRDFEARVPFRQLLGTGVMHTDPHGGNLLKVRDLNDTVFRGWHRA